MANRNTIMLCAVCKKLFSYIPNEDRCQPGSPDQICDSCCEQLLADIANSTQAKEQDGG